jgi:uncharacterized protein (DUF58 family)
MLFSSGAMSKYEYGCTVAAALTYLLLRQQDAVSLVTFDEGIRTEVPARSQQNHLHAILSALDAQNPAHKTDMYGVLRHLAGSRSRRGLIVIISDLLADRANLFRGLSLLRHRGHDVLVFHLLDDQELDFNYSGTTMFEGMEAAPNLVCDPRSLRAGYLQAVGAFLDELRRHCASHLIDYQTIRTSEHLDAALRHYLNHRIGMRQSPRN